MKNAKITSNAKISTYTAFYIVHVCQGEAQIKKIIRNFK